MTSEIANVSKDIPDWRLRVFFDGACPLCAREIFWLMKRTGPDRVRYEDISAHDFDPSGFGKSLAEFHQELIGQLPDGSFIRGMDVFRQLYAAAGLGWLLAPTSWPVLRLLFDWIYAGFARNRLRLTGRCKIKNCDW